MSTATTAAWTPPQTSVRLPSAAVAAGLRAGDAWRCLRTACAPFREGTRFQALPDVRFWGDGARQRAPGARLPGVGDRTATVYRARLQAAGLSSFALRVDEPLLADAPLWQAARALLSDAFGANRAPVLRVSAALTLCSGVERPPWTWRAGHARLVAVLQGRLRIGGEVGDVSAGDAAWLPARMAVPQDPGALLLVLSIAADPATIRSATRVAAEDLLLRLLERRRPDPGTVAMLPSPPAIDGACGVATIPALRALAQALAAAPLHATLAEAVALDAALRTSSLGLTPRPPQAPAPLRDGARLRLCAQGIVRQRLDDARWLFAVNGHPLIADDRAGWRRLWARLCEGGAWRVDALAGRGRDAAALRAWLVALHALGGLCADDAG
ncbi:MAG: hypothetical protein JF600_12810 [Xanthomonadales bacterium]|nr:hypothetical protein [Xanthomonadales bacterium]